MAVRRADRALTAVWRIAALCALSFVLALALTLVATQPATAQDDGLVASTSKTYTPDPASNEIRVAATYTLTNVTGDQQVNGSSVRSFFFRTWGITVPANATDFVAIGSGQSLSFDFESHPSGESLSIAKIFLPFDLQYQQTVTLEVSFRIPGSAPRGEAFAARANGSYFSFPVWVAGDAGRAAVRIEAPDGFDIEFQGTQGLDLRTEDDRTFYEIVDIANPDEFFVRVFGRNDRGLLAEDATIENATATVRSWPDDPEWANFVIDAFEEDVPIMEDLIGIDWPAGDIEVIESVTPYLRGYGGWFNRTAGEIEIGDVLDRQVILHEFAHGWFNQRLIGGRWIAEGFADEFASQTIAASGDERPLPERPSLTDPVRVQLNDWAAPFTLSREEQADYELYHYNAAWWVVHEITDEVGVSAMSQVLVTLDAGGTAYSEPGESLVRSPNWKQLLDLVERTAGSTEARELLEVHVLNDFEASLLDDRDRAIGAYDELLERTTSWDAPLGVRQSMARWEFKAVEARILDAYRVLEISDRIASRAVDLQISYADSPVEDRYESALWERDFDEGVDLANQRLRALEVLAHSRDFATSAADKLRVNVSFPAAEFAAAVDQVELLSEQLDELTDARAAAEERAATLGLTMPAWPQSDDDVDFDAEAMLVVARVETLDVIEAASLEVGESHSVMQQIGLWGSDPQADLDAARSSFEAGEGAQARTASAAARSTIASAAGSGRNRVIWTAVIASLLIAASAAVFVRQRRSVVVPEPPI